MSGPLQYLHAEDPTDTPAAGDVPVFGTTGYVPTNIGTPANFVSSAGTLTSNAIVLGAGSKTVAALGSLGTTVTVLHGNAAGAPSFAAVSLSADVSGNLPVTNLDSGSGASNTTFWRGDGVWGTPAGAGDVSSNTSTSVDSEIALFSSTSGKVIKRATTTGVLKASSGVIAAATDGTDYLSPSTGWTKIATVTTASSQATVDFSSIPSTYTNLRVLYETRDTASGTSASALRLKINGDNTAANYTSATRSGTNNTTTITTQVASATNLGGSIGDQPNDGNTAGFTATGEVRINSYKGTTNHKRVWAENDYEISGAFVVMMLNFRWASTAAINQLTFGTGGTAFKDGSVFTLYGMP